MQSFIKSSLLATALFAVSAIAQTNYSVKITKPEAEQGYQRPAQTVDIVIEVSPKLDKLDTLAILIDGKAVAFNKAEYSFASLDYEPGEHTVRVEVQNEAGKAVASDERTIYLIQNTPLMRAKKQAAADQAAFDALPWYKKVGKKRPEIPTTYTPK